MRNGTNDVTLRGALAAARAEVQQAEKALEAARDRETRLIVEALEAGATYREMARELDMSVMTVHRRYASQTQRGSALDRPAPAATSRKGRDS